MPEARSFVEKDICTIIYTCPKNHAESASELILSFSLSLSLSIISLEVFARAPLSCHDSGQSTCSSVSL